MKNKALNILLSISPLLISIPAAIYMIIRKRRNREVNFLYNTVYDKSKEGLGQENVSLHDKAEKADEVIGNRIKENPKYKDDLSKRTAKILTLVKEEIEAEEGTFTSFFNIFDIDKIISTIKANINDKYEWIYFLEAYRKSRGSDFIEDMKSAAGEDKYKKFDDFVSEYISNLKE